MGLIENWLYKEKRILVLCREINGTYHIQRAMKIKNFNAEKITIGKEDTVKINQNYPTFVKNVTRYYYHDVVSNTPLTFQQIEGIISTKQFNTLLDDKLVRDLTRSMIDKPLDIKLMIMYIALGAGVTGFIMMILIYLGVL